MKPEENGSHKQLSTYPAADKLVFLLISVVLGGFLVIRAIYVPMAHDEIATFYYFVQSGKVSPFLTNIDTNNHFLNSMLTWVSYRFFGPSPLALRLPNLIFAPVFFFFLYKITSHLKNRVFRFAFFISMAFTLHFIEFLALSRGYGISLALLLGSLWYLLEGISRQKLRYYSVSLLFIFVACTANLALINTYALMLAFVCIMLITSEINSFRLKAIAILAAGILPLSLVLVQIFYIKQHNGLIAGSPHDFWGTTITSLFSYLFEATKSIANRIATVLFLAIAIACILSFYKQFKKKGVPGIRTYLFPYLLAGNLVSILLLGVFFKVNYPDDRIGIYLYPLAIGSLIFLLDSLLTGKYATRLVALLFLVIPVHFIVFANTSYSIWYKYDVIPARFYAKVMQNHKPGEMPPTIAGHGMRIFCWSYLDYLHGGVASSIFFTHFPDYMADFQIVNLKMIPGWQTVYDTVDYDPVSERHLLKVQKEHIYDALITRSIPETANCCSEFVPLAEGSADTLQNKCIRLDLKFALFSAQKPFNGRVVCDIWDKQHKSLRYEYIQFNWLRNVWDGEIDNFSNCMLVYNIPPEAAEYHIYIWNIDKTPVSINQGRIRINELR